MKHGFSVILPLHNKEKYILRTLQSVLAQECSEFELIVVDDGSTDASVDLVKTITDSRIKLLSQGNAGVSAARNAGILAAANPYLAFLDGDDIWKPSHLTKLSHLIADFPEAGLYCMGYEFIEANGESKLPLWPCIAQRGYVARYFQSAARGDQIATASSACIPRRVFENVGMFPVEDKLGEDQDMWARIAVTSAVAADSEPTAIYFRHADMQRGCSTGNYQQELPYSRRLQAKLDRGQVTGDMYNDIKEYIKTGLFTLVSVNLRRGDKQAARRILQDPRLRNINLRSTAWRVISLLPTTMSQFIFKFIAMLRKRPKNSFRQRIHP